MVEVSIGAAMAGSCPATNGEKETAAENIRIARGFRARSRSWSLGFGGVRDVETMVWEEKRRDLERRAGR